jgi:hypothetical protein
MLIGGAILFSIGLVGEYVGRIYEQVKSRPLYLVKESSPELSSLPLDLDGRRRGADDAAAA